MGASPAARDMDVSMPSPQPSIEHLDVSLEGAQVPAKRSYDYAMEAFDKHKVAFEAKPENRGKKLRFDSVEPLSGQPATIRVHFVVLVEKGFAKRR